MVAVSAKFSNSIPPFHLFDQMTSGCTVYVAIEQRLFASASMFNVCTPLWSNMCRSNATPRHPTHRAPVSVGWFRSWSFWLRRTLAHIDRAQQRLKKSWQKLKKKQQTSKKNEPPRQHAPIVWVCGYFFFSLACESSAKNSTRVSWPRNWFLFSGPRFAFVVHRLRPPLNGYIVLRFSQCWVSLVVEQ